MGQLASEDERSTEAFQDPGYARGERADYAPPPSPEAARGQGRQRGPDAWRSEWGEPEPEVRVPEPRLTPAGQDQPQVAPTRQESWVAPTMPDYQRVGETAHESSYRSEPGSDAAAYHAAEEAVGYTSSGHEDSDPVAARFESDGTGIPLEWEDD
jgi:hypothetical protein